MSRLTRNVLTTYAARLSNIIGLFFLFPIVARAVTQDSFGIYVLTSSLAVFFTLDLGMAGATTAYIARAWRLDDYPRARQLIASSTLFFLGVGMAGAIVVGLTIVLGWKSFGFSADLAQTAVVCTVAASLQVLVASALSVNRHALSGVGRLDVANASQVVQVIARFCFTILVLALGGDVSHVALVDLAAVTLAGLYSWVARRAVARMSISPVNLASWPVFRGMFKLTRDFLVISLAALVILQTGNLIVSLTLPLVMVAVYGTAVRVYQVTREVTNSLTTALLPAASSNHAAGDLSANREIYFRGTRLANVLLLSVAVPVIVLADPLISTWMGAAYSGAVLPAQILIGSLVFNNQHLLAVPVLGGQGDLKRFAQLHSVWALSTLILGFVLTPSLGITGMALAVAAPVVCLEPFYIRVAANRVGLSMSDFVSTSILRPILPAAALFIGLLLFTDYYQPRGLLATGAVAVVTAILYLLLYLLAFAPAPDRRLARSAIARFRRREI